MKKRLAILLVLPMVFGGGCSLNNGPKQDWDAMGPKIQRRVKYVAAFAFSMDQVKPYKAQVCETTDQIIELLNNYNNQEASFDAVRVAVMDLVDQIDNEGVRNAVMIFADIILTESFNYAWKHYSDWVKQDQVRTAIVVARAVSRGLRDACNLVASSASAMPNDIFTVPKE